MVKQRREGGGALPGARREPRPVPRPQVRGRPGDPRVGGERWPTPGGGPALIAKGPPAPSGNGPGGAAEAAGRPANLSPQVGVRCRRGPVPPLPSPADVHPSQPTLPGARPRRSRPPPAVAGFSPRPGPRSAAALAGDPAAPPDPPRGRRSAGKCRPLDGAQELPWAPGWGSPGAIVNPGFQASFFNALRMLFLEKICS